MKTFCVTWGEEKACVYAEDANEAWALFVKGNEVCTKHPNLYPRTIKEVTEQPVAASSDVAVSPVADMKVDEAKDHIGRMRSPEKLQEIIDADKRSSVVDAARNRLTELGGS